MMVIGLTGGIGSGKSTVSTYLKERGYEIIDADRIAREIVEPGSSVLKQLAQEFGPSILGPDGSLKRKRLGAMVFEDAAKKKRLDAITHGEIKKRIVDRLREAESFNDVVFLDVPLLYETGMEQLTQQVWVVDLEDELRVRRVMERDGLTAAEVVSRIAGQMPREEKLGRADRVLSNSGTPQELYAQIDQLLGEIE